MKSKLKLILTMLALVIFILPLTTANAASKQIILKTTTEYTILKGEKVLLYVKGYKNSQKVKWLSSNKSVASVSKKGVVTGKKGGTATITATIGNEKYRAKIFVMTGEDVVYEHDISPNAPYVDRYEFADDEYEYDDEPCLNKTTVYMSTADTTSLKVLNTNKKITWHSSNEDVAKISSNGKITPVWFGSATISAKVDGKTLKCKVRVLAEDYWCSDDSNLSVTIMRISDQKIRVRIFAQNGTETISSGDLIGRYDDDGQIIIINKGKYNISAGLAIVEDHSEMYCILVVADSSNNIFITDGTTFDIKEENS